jgi:hypothetical protein
MKLVRALLLLVVAPAADATTCTSSIADMFANDIATGERGYLLTEDKPPLGATAGADGETTDYLWNMATQCLVKSDDGSVKEPSAEYMMQRSMFWIFSKLSCVIMNEEGITGGRRLTSESGSGGETEAVGQSFLDTCGYPQEYISTETSIAERGTEQNSWFGPLMQLPRLNGEELNSWTLDEPAVHSHAPIDGVTSSVCSMDRGLGDDSATHGGGARRNTKTWYDGGVQMAISRGSYLTFRAFQFKNAETRAAAVAAATDTLNPGLQYASTFAGNNGCDVEIVLEITPISGGGVHLEVSLPLEAMTEVCTPPRPPSTPLSLPPPRLLG